MNLTEKEQVHMINLKNPITVKELEAICETDTLDTADWEWICLFQPLTEEFMEKYEDKLYWNFIVQTQHLSEAFIEKHMDKFDGGDWYFIPRCQTLSESFIERHQDKLDWNDISCYQKLSESFIEKYQDKLSWHCIACYQKLSKSFIKKYKDKLSPNDLKKNWAYKSVNFKRDQVAATGLYDCHDTYFIGYKVLSLNGYEKYNYCFRFEKGKTYETHADYANDDYSFGFHICSEDRLPDKTELRKYKLQYKIVKCKVNYSDVARILSDGEVRCSTFAILDDFDMDLS